MQIAKGEKQALDTLYKQFGRLLFAMAKKYLFDKSKAEDIISEVLLRLVKSAKTFKRGHNGLNWLFKSIRNEATDTNKKDNRNSTENIDDCTDIRHIIDFDEKTLSDIVFKQALDSLSDLEHKALYYKFWEGLTVRETGKELGVSRMKAQRVICEALKKLEIFLGQNDAF